MSGLPDESPPCELRGTAAELGISAANLWIQPANAANGYDALEGELSYFKLQVITLFSIVKLNKV